MPETVADKINQGLRSASGSGLRTRIITTEWFNGGWTWSAPIRARRGIAMVKVCPHARRKYRSEESAKANAVRHIRALFPLIVFE